jgi:ABC-type glutathione transport system ATPase component
MEPLLSVDLNVDYAAKAGVLRNLKFDLFPGEIVGFAGQSGSGKSTLALSIMRLLSTRNATVSGHVLFRGVDLLSLSTSDMRRIRGRDISLALQAASSALNPHLRIETQMKEAWKAHEKAPWSQGRQRALDTLAAMDLDCDEQFLRRYPPQISIGQAQRIVLAMALLHRPALLIADEPTSALDLMAQLELLTLLKRVNRDFGVAILYISHDLGTVKYLCHRVCVLNDGRIEESGTPDALFARPAAEFTKDLMWAYAALNAGAGVDQSMTYPAEKNRTPA